MSKQQGKVQLESRISGGTGLQTGTGGDYSLDFVKNKRRVKEPSGDEFNPENWVFLHFHYSKDKELIDGKRFLILNFLEKEKIENFKDKNAYLIRIPNVKIKKVLEPEIKTPPKKDPPDEVIKSFNRLKELHKRLPIYGVPNKDQPDLFSGIAHFNYFPDDEQTQKALQIFKTARFGVEERAGKKHNLTFVLLTDGVDETKLPFGKGRPNGKTPDIFSWIIRKVYRKTLKNFSERMNLGISERATINVGEPEIFDLKKSLEEDFEMIMLLYKTYRTKSEFCLLISDKAKDLYYQSERNISACDIIQILKDPKQENEIIKKYSLLKDSKMEQKKILSTELIRLFKNAGFKTAENREQKPYAQISHLSVDEIKVSIIKARDESARKKIAYSLSEAIIAEHPDAEIKKGGGGVNFIVGIPGFVNPQKRILGPRKKKVLKNTLIPKEKPQEKEVGTIPIPEKPNEEKVKTLPVTEPSKTEDLSENVESKRAQFEKRLRKLIEDGYIPDKELQEAKEYLLRQEAKREVISILKALNSLED